MCMLIVAVVAWVCKSANSFPLNLGNVVSMLLLDAAVFLRTESYFGNQDGSTFSEKNSIYQIIEE